MAGFSEDTIRRPELISGDVVDAVMYDDPTFMEQVMDMDDGDTSILDDLTEDFDDVIIPDDVCGDSLDMLDREADEFIVDYNSIDDENGEIIDQLLGLRKIV